MVEDDITIHPQNSLNSVVIKVIQNLFISNKFLFSNTMIIFVPQIKKSDHTIDR